ncbi:MAG: glycerate kinase [Paracoccaceae bacterium]|nr:glycerate kinase [Paracoccaceae bacterium]
MSDGFDAERAFLRELFDVAVAAASPTRAIPQHIPEPPAGRCVVVGAGKASAAMARAFEQHYPGRCEGLVITRYGHAVACDEIEIIEAAHPVPDTAGVAATARIMDIARGLGPDDLLVALISGGGSSLLTLPAPGLGLADKQAVNAALLASGLPIDRMNLLRKHLSAIKGGRLAATAWPAPVLVLMISDVPGDDPGTIASGPTVGDETTLEQARAVLDALPGALPPAVSRALANPANETPFPDDPRLVTTENRIIAAPMMSLHAAAEQARAQGITPIILGDALEGEARKLGRQMARDALARCGRAPCVLLSGGETTVTLPQGASGTGGRNVEFLMGLAQELDGARGICALACDTDGIDGGAEVAGAIVTPDTIARARAAGYPLEHALERHDGHGFFARLNDQIITGPTLTNVNDFRAILVTQ